MGIAVLEEQVVNQIAAGEVIERPASVVKELVENALDAGAGRVRIAVEGGGQGLIRVTDDGVGITGTEVELAFLRHATSKLRHAEDLWAVRTLGFRGEALPSIAAVARVVLTTRTASQSVGRRLELVGGVVAANQEWGAPVGTTVEVRDLFFNTPARRKFLKSEAAEAGRIAALVTALAAVHPEVGFTLTTEGRTVVQTPGTGDLRETLGALLPGRAGRDLLAVESEASGLKVSGYAGSSALTWANRNWELFAVNGRLVESRLLQAALEKAYGGFLPLRRYPVALLAVTVDPAQVDVNVHPTKREVRFRREGELFQAIHRAVAGALGAQELYRPAVPQGRTGWQPAVAAAELALAWSPAESVGTQTAIDSNGLQEEPPVSESDGPAESRGRTELRYLGQAAGSYLVVETADGLVLVDQHAAHERVIYDALRTSLELGAPLPVQALLLPQRLDLAPVEAACLKETLPVLEALGFAVEAFGGRSVLVRAIPVLLSGLDLRSVLAEATEEGGANCGGRPQAVEGILQRLACRAAVKANHRLSVPEASALLAEWQATAQPWTCPHGRPVALRWSFAEVAAAFWRR